MMKGVTAIFSLQLRYPWLDGFLAYTGMGPLPFAGRQQVESLLLHYCTGSKIPARCPGHERHICRGKISNYFYYDRYWQVLGKGVGVFYTGATTALHSEHPLCFWVL